jgi:hypothetical protein
MLDQIQSERIASCLSWVVVLLNASDEVQWNVLLLINQ